MVFITMPEKPLAVSADKDIEGNPAIAKTSRLVLLVEYSGSRYHGFQLQKGQPTIQGELEKALKELSGRSTRVTASSRTDSGVHAAGQVVSFKTDSSLATSVFINGLNYYLPPDIAVKSAYRVETDFNVRKNAVSREYSYRILNQPTRSPLWDGCSYLVSGNLDIEKMNRAAEALLGCHDFASFASKLGNELKNTVRRVYRAQFTKQGGIIILDMQANAFLPHQVRNTVGALIRVGLGRVTVDHFHSIMEARQMGLAGPAVPACGLCLMKVNYRKNLEEYDIENL
jgi:tRNA pseudouridine38-40 synthase